MNRIRQTYRYGSALGSLPTVVVIEGARDPKIDVFEERQGEGALTGA